RARLPKAARLTAVHRVLIFDAGPVVLPAALVAGSARPRRRAPPSRQQGSQSFVRSENRRAACFVGHVGRRKGTPLSAVRGSLGGWATRGRPRRPISPGRPSWIGR